MTNPRRWQKADKGDVHKELFQEVSKYEEEQIGLYDRFAALEALYDPRMDDPHEVGSKRKRNRPRRPLVATTVDTVHATITAQGIRPRFLTEDGNWKTQRRAAKLSRYADSLKDLFKVLEKASHGAKLSGLKGAGYVQVHVDPLKRLRVEPVCVDDLVVNPKEAQQGYLRQLHRARVRSVDELIVEYPGKKDEIRKAAGSQRVMMERYWAEWREIDDSQVATWESWYLPVGRKPDGWEKLKPAERRKQSYEPGRHVICCEGADLLDEEWHEEFFPLAEFVWSKRAKSVGPPSGIGLVERIEGNQRTMDKYQRQVELMLDKHAVPTTYLQRADANVAIKTVNRAGTFIINKSGQAPHTIIPPAVSPELYRREDHIEQAFMRDSGVNQMAAQGVRPPGVPESGVGLREYRDQTTVRFAPQEQGYEDFVLQIIVLMIWACKELGDDAPVVTRRGLSGPEKIRWADVEMPEVEVQIVAASDMSQTPTGRAPFVAEMAQGGVISQDVARKLLMPNSPLDVESEMSLYAAAMESADQHIQEILDGGTAVPEPYQNARMNTWRGTQELLVAERRGAPERVLENLRQWITQSAWIVARAEEAEMAAQAGPAAMPGPPGPAPGSQLTGAGVEPINLA